MWGSLDAKRGAAGLAVLAIGLSACGAEDEGTTETARKVAATTTAADAQPGLERFLLARGEEPGYTPSGDAETLSTAEEYAARGPRADAVTRRLLRHGFAGFMRRPLEGQEGPGVTSVMLFATAAGARRDAATDRRNLARDYRGWKLERFSVAGVPGAFGWTATNKTAQDAPPGERVGNVVWVEGRCVLSLGNAGAKTFLAPLTVGARALHRRVRGRCS